MVAVWGSPGGKIIMKKYFHTLKTHVSTLRLPLSDFRVSSHHCFFCTLIHKPVFFHFIHICVIIIQEKATEFLRKTSDQEEVSIFNVQILLSLKLSKPAKYSSTLGGKGLVKICDDFPPPTQPKVCLCGRLCAILVQCDELQMKVNNKLK